MTLVLASLVTSPPLVSASSTASSTASGSPSAPTTSKSGCRHFGGFIFSQSCYYCGAGGVAGPDGVGLVKDGFVCGGIEVHVRYLVADD